MATHVFPSIITVDHVRCNLSKLELSYDEACLLVTSDSQELINVFAQSKECLECDLLKWASANPQTTVPLLIKSKYPLSVELRTRMEHTICSWEQQFVEKGVFELNVNNTACGTIITLKEPDDTVLPLLVIFLIFLGLLLISAGIKYMCSSDWYRQLTFRAISQLENDLGNIGGNEAPLMYTDDHHQIMRNHRTRVKSLDTFRGLCIALMIFVNYGGGGYLLFEHSVWNGLTIADVLFPSFMWIMGLSMVLSMRSQLRNSVTRCQLLWRVIVRGLKLIAIGAVLNSMHGGNNFSTYRICGVLQRLGVCYIVVGLMESYQLTLQSPQHFTSRLLWLQDLKEAWPQWMVTLWLVAAHTAITFALIIPNCPKGYLGPGGLHEHELYINCTGGAAGYIDKLLLTNDHLYERPTCKKIYHTHVNYDPEGILGFLTSVLLVQLGVHAGRVLLIYPNPWTRIVRWCIWSILTGLIGGLLCNFSKDGGIIPINKNLYSLSFVLINASLDFIMLAVLYLMVDVKRWWGGAPFYIAGMNSLVLYVGHIITNNSLPWKWQPMGTSHAELLYMHVWATGLWILIAYQLYRSKFFLTV